MKKYRWNKRKFFTNLFGLLIATGFGIFLWYIFYLWLMEG